MPKTRFVCVSDTHAYTPSEAGFRLPPGDVLIHAGDLTTRGSLSELQKTLQWIIAADYEVKIVISGNHDITLDPRCSPDNSKKALEEAPKCMEAIASSSSILFLRHESALVRLTRPGGPNTVFTVFGSPYSPSRSHGTTSTWTAFGYESEAAPALWQLIPLDVDIVVTHTPPHSLCDRRTTTVGPEGCPALRQRLARVRPLLAVCGHVHESRGCERVRWASASSPPASSIPLETEHVERVALPPRGSKKQSLVDLTGKRTRRLENEGFAAERMRMRNALPGTGLEANTRVLRLPRNETAVQWLMDDDGDEEDDGFRARRRESCVINAATLATSWPHPHGKLFNAPIVVDLDLPRWKGWCDRSGVDWHPPS
ncbi:Metallo-dependent phosphatase-like protein [Aspergillus ambiguus]|uniref:metallophosphatase domain-containing protein n=1 Tax=Aspergillus ambiguus TaxID=176160 RepID=UPI003CCE233A